MRLIHGWYVWTDNFFHMLQQLNVYVILTYAVPIKKSESDKTDSTICNHSKINNMNSWSVCHGINYYYYIILARKENRIYDYLIYWMDFCELSGSIRMREFYSVNKTCIDWLMERPIARREPLIIITIRPPVLVKTSPLHPGISPRSSSFYAYQFLEIPTIPLLHLW